MGLAHDQDEIATAAIGGADMTATEAGIAISTTAGAGIATGTAEADMAATAIEMTTALTAGADMAGAGYSNSNKRSKALLLLKFGS